MLDNKTFIKLLPTFVKLLPTLGFHYCFYIYNFMGFNKSVNSDKYSVGFINAIPEMK